MTMSTLLPLLLVVAAASVVIGQDMGIDCLVNNQQGCKLIRDPEYLVVAPRKVRPNQLINVYVTILRLLYPHLIVRVSIIKDGVEYAETEQRFDQPGSRILEMQTPGNMGQGNYKIRLEGRLKDGQGFVFRNESDIEFQSKQTSVFIQMSKPLYKQGQHVYFRVIPIQPNLMPRHGSMTVYALDPSGLAVRRWQGQQTNAGGFVSLNFVLSDQPRYGKWSIKVEAYGHEYFSTFDVLEFWEPRFDVNVTVPPYVFDNAAEIKGVVYSNHTSGKASFGSATILTTIVPRGDRYTYDYRNTRLLPSFATEIEYFSEGRIDFSVSKERILEEARDYGNPQSIEGMEFFFNVTVRDWILAMNRTGFGSTYCYTSRISLKWVGDPIRTFKPGTIFAATVALVRADGTAVNELRPVTLVPRVQGGSGYIPEQPRLPVNGLTTFAIEADSLAKTIIFKAKYTFEDGRDIWTDQDLIATKYYTPRESYITVTTSTKHPRVNEYMIFHLRTSVYVPKIFYQIVAQGNILIGDELRMLSRQKTFSVALSRDMIPTARIVVYFIRQPEEIVADSLNFFVNGTRMNPIHIRFNRGKDFTRHTVEINSFTDPGSYAAFSAIPYDLYKRGMTDGLSENELIDELLTYDSPANGSYVHKWRISEAEYQYNFFEANGYGVDAKSTFFMAGLVIMTDAEVTQLPNKVSCEELNQFACHDGISCYTNETQCDRVRNCPDGADEMGCPEIQPLRDPRHPLDRISHVMRFYDDSAWIWEEWWIKPNGRTDFRVNIPRQPLTWVVNSFSLSQEKGFGIMERPARFDATRLMYVQLEAPDVVVRREQIGFRVTIINYWWGDDYLEVLVQLRKSDDYKFIHVEEFGFVDSFTPRTSFGDHETLLFLEPGESKDIYMPVLPLKRGKIDITISASCYLSSDVITKTVYVESNGVEVYHHIPYYVDLIEKGAQVIPDLNIPVPETFLRPEQREWDYIPETPTGIVSIFGDVVMPGFTDEYLTVENILRRPYGSADGNLFNLAYNLYTLKFMKKNEQLPDDILRRTLIYMNEGFQRQLSYMRNDGSFMMFRDDETPSLWVSAFAARILYECKFGEWEYQLFIPVELVSKIVMWVCSQQNMTDGAFYPLGDVYDRKMTRIQDQKDFTKVLSDPIALTAYILIQIDVTEELTGEAKSVRNTMIQKATRYLDDNYHNVPEEDVFHMSLVAFALAKRGNRGRDAYARFATKKRTPGNYWADGDIASISKSFDDGLRVITPRIEHVNDAYGTQATAYGLLSVIYHETSASAYAERISIMTWLQTMRNTIGGFTSTQDTITALQALMAFTEADPNRNVYEIIFQQITSTADITWNKDIKLKMTLTNYTQPHLFAMEKVFGYIKAQVQGAGRAMLQVTTTMNVEYKEMLKPPPIRSFDLFVDNLDWAGRNFSIMYMRTCARWVNTERSLRSGMAVMEIHIPTGYVVMNDSLRTYVQSHEVENLRRAEFYGRKIVFYFSYIDSSLTCVNFRADRWFPSANGTREHMMRIFDYYETGLYNNSLYETFNLHGLNLCYACASFQCPFCPTFNAATIFKATFTLLSLILAYVIHRFLVRT